MGVPVHDFLPKRSTAVVLILLPKAFYICHFDTSDKGFQTLVLPGFRQISATRATGDKGLQTLCLSMFAL